MARFVTQLAVALCLFAIGASGLVLADPADKKIPAEITQIMSAPNGDLVLVTSGDLTLLAGMTMSNSRPSNVFFASNC